MTTVFTKTGKKEAGASDKDWSPDLYQEKLTPKATLSQHCAQAFTPRRIDDCISDERLERAYKGVADLVAKHGEEFLPIFQFLDREIEGRREKASLLMKAKSISLE